MTALIDHTGDRFGKWLVLERGETRRSKTGVVVVHWRVRCDCGTVTDVAANNLRSGRSTQCIACRPQPRKPRKPTVTYHGLHERLRYSRGLASDYECVCGCGPAEEWSLDTYAADDLIGEHHGSLVRYSLDLSRYVPRARRCHRAHDADQRRQLTT